MSINIPLQGKAKLRLVLSRRKVGWNGARTRLEDISQTEEGG